MNRLVALARVNKSLLFRNEESLRVLAMRSFGSSSPCLAGFAKDYKPGPYPRNEEERIAAAKKYNLRPEDYKPYPDDGLGFGDYPDLGNVSTDMKSDWEEYDDHYLKRNFGEPLHITAEQLTADKTTLKTHIMSFPKIVFWFLFGSSLFIGLNYLFWDYKASIPIAPKQYPRNVELYGEKHYKI